MWEPTEFGCSILGVDMQVRLYSTLHEDGEHDGIDHQIAFEDELTAASLILQDRLFSGRLEESASMCQTYFKSRWREKDASRPSCLACRAYPLTSISLPCFSSHPNVHRPLKKAKHDMRHQKGCRVYDMANGSGVYGKSDKTQGTDEHISIARCLKDPQPMQQQ